MNSHFNYELDERYIRLTMLDSDIECNELDWQRFEGARVKTKCSPSYTNLFSSIELNINRSVLVPAGFVVGIIILSSLLFSFVDFKGKSKTNDISSKSTETTIEPNIEPDAKVNTSLNSITNSSVGNYSLNTTEPKVIETSNQITQEVVSAPKPEIENVVQPSNSEVYPISVTSISSETASKTTTPKPKKKKEVYEELPSINATSKILESEKEPELDLDLK